MDKPSAKVCKHENTTEYRNGDKFIYCVCNDCGKQLTIEEIMKIMDDRAKGKVSISAPSYYTAGKIETWDFIIDKHLDFLEGNIVKYVVRWRQKNGVEDLKKARVYLDKLIQEAEKK
jgi:Protein of unknwon function (DUF3310).